MTRISATSITIFVTSLFLRSECVQDSAYLTPDVYLNTSETIRQHGYVAEEHIIQTADGYLLEYHRIPHGKNMKAAIRKYPILLHHGLLSSSADWLTTGPRTSLPYALSDNGFDVWLANARGNTYSKGHLKYSPSDRKFWNFSFHEIGVYDLPAAIDYILKVTSAEKVIYIGHSMGTTVFFVFASTHPEYNDKILFQISLAPIGAIPHSTSLVVALVPYTKKIQKVAYRLGNGAFLQRIERMQLICKLSPNLCKLIILSLCGVDREQLNASVIVRAAHTVPGGTSTKNMIHFSQLVSTGKFRNYDYGKDENVKKYKSETPPEYKISDIKVPIAFYYGQNDILASPKDVKKLYQQLSYPIGLIKIKYEKWNHVDFLWATEVNKYFINPLLEFVINATTDDSFVKKSVKKALVKRATKSLADNYHTPNESRYERIRLFVELHRTIMKWFMKRLNASVMRHKDRIETQRTVIRIWRRILQTYFLSNFAG